MKRIFFAFCLTLMVMVSVAPSTATATNQALQSSKCMRVWFTTYDLDYSYAITYLEMNEAQAHAFATRGADRAYNECKSIAP